MTAKRAPRAAAARVSNERVKEWQPPSKRVTLKSTKDVHLRWVRIASRGEDDRENMERRLREGYEVVSPEDELVREEVARGHLTVQEGRIVNKGLILMKIDRRLAQQRNEYYTKEANLHQQSVSEALERERHDKMPLTEDLKRTRRREG